MPIGISEDHQALHEAVRGWAARHVAPAVLRAALDAEHETRPPFWDALAAQGWLGLHVPEADGGSGFGLPELVVVVEEMAVAGSPGPFLPHVLATGVLAAAPPSAARSTFLPLLATGERIAAYLGQRVSRDDHGLHGEVVDGRLHVRGTVAPIMCGAVADVFVAVVAVGHGTLWCVLEAGEGVTVRPLDSLDPTRRVVEVTVDVVVPGEHLLGEIDLADVVNLQSIVMAADLVGVAQWCVDTAATYARDRIQFGRPIGQFQAVKHKCADMVCRLELARAAVWDAARAFTDPATRDLAGAAAIALAADAGFVNAKDCIQVLGGIGFTWEHDAHVYLRHAMADNAFLGHPSEWRARALRQALAGVRRSLSVDLGPAADVVRAEVRAFLAEVRDLDPVEQRRRVAEAGYLQPTWPVPWGRAARAVEQIVIDEEFRAARVPRPSIIIGAWALPPVILYGTEEQQRRWIPPTFTGEISWCQLFSEPGAGSDLAALTTRADRVEGGWVVNGQKVWTSMARQSDWGILLARTDPDAPKHDGISCFMLDMTTPGIDVRPLRELTGDAMFNEVFFDDVFVPDDCLVGAEHDGWRAARTTLANERVVMGSGMDLGRALEQILTAVADGAGGDDPTTADQVGALVVEAHALGCLGFRLTLAALAGADPSGSEAAVRKLLGVLHDQKVAEVGVHLQGIGAAIAEGGPAAWTRSFLFGRNLTIAGGTSEIQRNIIGERVLGLPRDP